MTDAAEPHVALVILNWNGKADILRCLSTLPRLRYPNWSATVIDNASTDGSVDAIRAAYPAQRVLVMEHNLGFCGGNNRGMQDALARGADYVLLLNNDTEMHPDLVSELVRVARTDSRIGAVGAKNLKLEDPTQVWGAYGKVTYGRHLVRVIGRSRPDGPAYGGVRDVEWVIGNGIMMSRAAIETVGGFDERFFGYHEDVDWCVCARARGFRMVYNGAAIIYHKGSAASAADREVPFPIQYFLSRNAVLFVWKHGSWWHRVQFFALMMIEIPRLMAVGVLRPSRVKLYLSVMRGFVDGVVGRLPLRALKLR
jgi:GT2 family glycosyltransferase